MFIGYHDYFNVYTIYFFIKFRSTIKPIKLSPSPGQHYGLRRQDDDVPHVVDNYEYLYSHKAETQER